MADVPIPDMNFYRSLPAGEFGGWVSQVLSRFEMTQRQSTFNISSAAHAGFMNHIITPLGDDKVLLYSPAEQSLISAALRVQNELKKTAEIGTGTRENFVLEIFKQVIGGMKLAP